MCIPASVLGLEIVHIQYWSSFSFRDIPELTFGDFQRVQWKDCGWIHFEVRCLSLNLTSWCTLVESVRVVDSLDIAVDW